MSGSATTRRLARKSHLYFGVFIAPALLFFAFTGAYQTFGLHETQRGSDYKPKAWEVTLAQIHKKQTTAVPVRRLPPGAAADTDRRKPDGVPQPVGAKSDVAPSPAFPPAKPVKSHLPLKIFFALVSLGLMLSTLTGIYMAYRYDRNKLLITGLLVAGIVIPLALLPF